MLAAARFTEVVVARPPRVRLTIRVSVATIANPNPNAVTMVSATANTNPSDNTRVRVQHSVIIAIPNRAIMGSGSLNLGLPAIALPESSPMPAMLNIQPMCWLPTRKVSTKKAPLKV